MKHITLMDFLTPDEIQLASKLKKASLIQEQIIAPNMARINKDLGQENDARYLAYLVEYVIGKVTTKM